MVLTLLITSSADWTLNVNTVVIIKIKPKNFVDDLNNFILKISLFCSVNKVSNKNKNKIQKYNIFSLNFFTSNLSNSFIKYSSGNEKLYFLSFK